ncbi:uncharacterized protein LOC144103529 [Amblyomma americanum]
MEDLPSPIDSGRPATRTLILRSKRPTVACLGCACGVAVAAATAALAWFAVHWSAERVDTGDTGKTFCCPSQAATLFTAIDNKQQPCKDFFAYVCNNALEDGLVQRDVALDALWDVTSDIIKGTQDYGSEAAVALHTLYTSCLKEIWQEDQRARHVAAVVLEIANSTRHMSGASLLRLALTVEKRYRLPFIFEVRSATGKTTRLTFVRWARRVVQYKHNCDASCYDVTLSILNSHFGSNYTSEDISKWEEKFPRVPRRRTAVSLTEITDAFDHIEVSEFKAILNDFLIDVERAKVILVTAKDGLFADIRLLIDTEHQPLALFYLLLLVSLEAMRYTQQDNKLSSPNMRSEDICHGHVRMSFHLWRITYVAALATPAKDSQLKSIFVATRRRFIDYGPLRRLVAAGNDTDHFRALVGNVSLMLPGDLVFREPPVPRMTSHGFVRNFFLALNFEFDAKKETVRQGVPWFRENPDNRAADRMFFANDTTLYVSTLGYGWLSSGTNDPLLADAAVIASRMAALLWLELVAWRGWSRETEAALQSHRECVLSASSSKYLEAAHPVVELKMGLQVAAIVGAAGTAHGEAATPAAARASWYTMQDAWSLFRMSEAQFFYARFAYYRCSTDSQARALVNELVRGNIDFARAFQCPLSKYAVEQGDCINITLPKST